MNLSGKITLAIESAVCGGSISLLQEGIEIANWIGESSVSKAEDLLVNIDALLTQNNISRREIDLIAVSAGPGSFTGIRIGIATALGLKNGLSINTSSESALKAMIFTGPDTQNVTTAVPMGRNAVCLQSFRKSGVRIESAGAPQTLAENAFLDMVRDKADRTFVLHEALYQKTGQLSNVINFGTNIARAIGLICQTNAGVMTKPMFISKNF